MFKNHGPADEHRTLNDVLVEIPEEDMLTDASARAPHLFPTNRKPLQGDPVPKEPGSPEVHTLPHEEQTKPGKIIHPVERFEPNHKIQLGPGIAIPNDPNAAICFAFAPMTHPN